MSTEFFTRDPDGRKSDAELHEPILANGDTAAAFAASTYIILKGAGLTDEEIRKGYTKLYDEMTARGLKP